MAFDPGRKPRWLRGQAEAAAVGWGPALTAHAPAAPH